MTSFDKVWLGMISYNLFLGAKAPLGLVTVSESVTNKKVGNFKILQDLTTK